MEFIRGLHEGFSFYGLGFVIGGGIIYWIFNVIIQIIIRTVILLKRK